MKRINIRYLCAIGMLMLAACYSREQSPTEQQQSGNVAVAGSEQVRTEGSRFTDEELREILAKSDVDDLSAALNQVKKLGVSRDGLELLKAVWARDESQYPEFAWSSIADPQVHLDLVDLLVQAAANGEIDAKPAGAHEFVHSVIRAGSPNDVSKAVISLSLFERKEDVPTIEGVAAKKDSRTFRSAVIALSRMCAPEADAALVRLEARASGSDKAFVGDTRARMLKFKQDGGVCPR